MEEYVGFQLSTRHAASRQATHTHLFRGVLRVSASLEKHGQVIDLSGDLVKYQVEPVVHLVRGARGTRQPRCQLTPPGPSSPCVSRAQRIPRSIPYEDVSSTSPRPSCPPVAPASADLPSLDCEAFHHSLWSMAGCCDATRGRPRCRGERETCQ